MTESFHLLKNYLKIWNYNIRATLLTLAFKNLRPIFLSGLQLQVLCTHLLPEASAFPKGLTPEESTSEVRVRETASSILGTQLFLCHINMELISISFFLFFFEP